MSESRRPRELSDMPRVEAAIHPEVYEAYKRDAKERGISVRSVVREALYDYAREFLGVDVGDAPVTTYATK